jgi:GH24 family phage-related lysozyme (muramidase)
MIKVHSREAAKFVAAFYRGSYPEHVVHIDLARADKLMQMQPNLSKVLNQNQWDAVASLALSVLRGEANHAHEHELIGCSLFKNLSAQNLQLALADMAEYVYHNGQFSRALEQRRKQEIKLFLTPPKTVL